MSLNEDLDRIMLGRKLEEYLPQIPTAESTIRSLSERLASSFPLIDIGYGADDTDSFFTREDLNSHIHILGSTREGKSKFLELLIRKHIDDGYGCCLIDPSDNGDTCYKVLKYCIDQGHEKVLLIDPHDIHLWDENCRVPVFNPIRHPAPRSVVMANLMDSVRMLWKTESFAGTAIVEDYVPAIFAALHSARMTLAETRYFGREHDLFRRHRAEILATLPSGDDSRIALEEVYSNPGLYKGEYRSTIRRLKYFRDEIFQHMLGSGCYERKDDHWKQTGINFEKLISEGYVVLVNLDSVGVWGAEAPQQRLLGTLILNELLYSIHFLRSRPRPWEGRYYILIDECGDYTSAAVKNVLDKKAKAGIAITLSHQGFEGQLSKDIAASVQRGAKLKVLFNTTDPDDRLKMIRMMFGGELSDRQVSYHLQDTAQRNCWIKNNKQKPVKARIMDLPDIDVKPAILTDFKKKIYSSEFYKSVGQIRAETQSRFAKPTPKPFGGGKAEPRRKKQDSAASPASQVPDNKATGRTDAGSEEPKKDRGWRDIKTPFD